MDEVRKPSNKSALLRPIFMLAGAAAVGTGTLAIAFGSFWAPTALGLFSGNEIVQKFELVVPFMPILLIALGAFLAVKSRQ